MRKDKQNPAGGPGLVEKSEVCDDRHLLTILGARGNSASDQRSRLLAALRKGSITTLEARRLIDVLHPAARIMELRRNGHKILTIWTTDVTSEGKQHRVARYLLRDD